MSDDVLRRVAALEKAMRRPRAEVAPRIGCRIFNTSPIALTTGINTALTFDSETYDVGNLHSTSVNTGRITVSDPGIYVFTGHVEFASNATGVRQLFIRRNGTEALGVILVPAVSGAVTVLSVATEFLMSAGDYVELVALQTSGGNLNVNASNFYSPYFTAVRVK